MAYPNYTVVEAQNVAMGQSGNAFVDTAGSYTPPHGKIVAITMLTDVEFTELTPESTSSWCGTTADSPGTGGDTVAAGDTFPSGITIYGRWDSFELNSAGDKVIVYFG